MFDVSAVGDRRRRKSLVDTNPAEQAGTQDANLGPKTSPGGDQSRTNAGLQDVPVNKEIYAQADGYNPATGGAGTDFSRGYISSTSSARPKNLTETERIRQGQGKMQGGYNTEKVDRAISNGDGKVALNPRGIAYIETTAPVVEVDENGNRKWGSRQMRPRSFLVNKKGEITNTLEATGFDANGNATGWKSSERGRYWGDHYDPKALDPVETRPKALTGDDAVRAVKVQGAINRVAARLRNGEAPSQAMIEARQRWAAQPGSRPTQSGRALAQAQQVQSYLSSTDAAADRYREMQKNNNLYSTQVRPTYLSGEDNYETAMKNARKEAEERLRFEEAANKAREAREYAQIEAIRAGATALTNLGTNPSPSTVAAAAKAAGGNGEVQTDPPKTTK